MDSGSKEDDEADYRGADTFICVDIILQRLVGKQYLFSICCNADRKTAAVDLKLPNLLQLTTVIKDQPEIKMRFLSVSLT
jgi:hypothetical protein